MTQILYTKLSSWKSTFILHPKFRNINLHSVTRSLTSRNHRERIFTVQISLLIVTYLSLTSRICHWCKPPKKSTHTLALLHVSTCGVSSSSSSSATCWMLVHAYATLSRKAKWSGPQHNIKMLHICYANFIVSRIHVSTTKLCNIMCTLVATCVILRRLECMIMTLLIRYSWTPKCHIIYKGQKFLYDGSHIYIELILRLCNFRIWIVDKRNLNVIWC